MPRLGLLLGDRVDAAIRHRFGDYDDMVCRTLATKDFGCDVEVFDLVQEEFPLHVADCDAYVIPGSRHSVLDSAQWISDLFSLIRDVCESNVKLVGICFGHQAIAVALGGSVRKSEYGWQVGLKSYEIHNHPAWLDNRRASIDLLVSHQDRVEKLSPNAKLLFSHPECPIAGFTVESNVVSLQAHPEFDSAFLKYLYRERKPRLGCKFEEAMSSLDKPNHSDLIAKGLGNFMSWSS